jgi:triacylglycerol lipase
MLVVSACAGAAPAPAPETTPAPRAPRVGAAAAPDFARIAEHARRADLAYQPDSVIRRAFPGADLLVAQLPSVAGQVYVVTDHASREHRIAARGTANLRNALFDAKYVKRFDAAAGILLHEGFEQSAQAAYAAIRPALRPGYRISLTGHSLGGAVAAILMMYLHHDGFEIHEAVTFGQPKVTNAQGAALFERFPLLRIVDCGDPVPLLPPPTVLAAASGRFEHFGAEVLLFDGPAYALVSPQREQAASSPAIWERLLHDHVANHHMQRYLDRIDPKLAGATSVPAADPHRHGCVAAGG